MSLDTFEEIVDLSEDVDEDALAKFLALSDILSCLRTLSVTRIHTREGTKPLIKRTPTLVI